MEKLKVFEGFAGIGACSKALERLHIPFELVGFSEIDKYAIKSFCAIHNVDENLNYGDICNIDKTTLPDFDLYTFGSPCQDFSVAGKQEGSKWKCNDCNFEYNPLEIHYSTRNQCPNCGSQNIDKTRSSLVVEALRIIEYKKPKYLLMENVKNLVGKKFKPSFDLIINELQEYGYNTYYKVLNAKDFGIPQNRERIFVVSIRKDINAQTFEFPVGFDNGLRLKDFLESEVDEKYYISQEKTDKLIQQLKDKQIIVNAESNQVLPCLTPDRVEKRQNGRRFKEDGEPSFTLTSQDRHGILINHGELQIKDDETCSCIDANYWKGLDNHAQRTGVLTNDCMCVGRIDINGHDYIKRVYSPEGVSPTVPTGTGGNHMPKIIEDFSYTNNNKVLQIGTLNGHQSGNVFNTDGIATTLCANGGGMGAKTGLYAINEPKIIQKVGDRGTSNYSIKDISNTIPANPMSDRGQLLIEPTILENQNQLIEFHCSCGGVFISDNLSEKCPYCEMIQSCDITYLNTSPKIIEDFYANRDIREYEEYSPTLRADRQGLKVVTHSEYVNKKYEEFYKENGYVPELFNPYNKTEIKDFAPTLTAQGDSITKSGTVLKYELNKTSSIPQYRIRKLTPKETMRLMGFYDTDYEKVKVIGISDTQIYKQSGNSIVTKCLVGIFGELFNVEYESIIKSKKSFDIT